MNEPRVVRVNSPCSFFSLREQTSAENAQQNLFVTTCSRENMFDFCAFGCAVFWMDLPTSDKFVKKNVLLRHWAIYISSQCKRHGPSWATQSSTNFFQVSHNIRSRPGKPNQRKDQNRKFMNFAHFCEFWCFSLGKQAQFTLNVCSGMPP